MHKFNKFFFKLIIGLIIVIISIGIIVFLRKEEVYTNVELGIGTVYRPDDNHVKHDEDTGVNYVNNIVIVHFVDEASEDDVKNIVKEIDGEIVSSIPMFNEYQIRIGEKSYKELVDLCETLESKEYVEFASIDIAIQLSTD